MLAAAALLLAVAAWVELRGLAAARDDVAGRLAATPWTEESRATTEGRIADSDSPSEVRLAAAANLVESEIASLGRPPANVSGDASGDASDSEVERRARRLDLAAELAAEAFALRPAAWEAPTLLGMARYLGWRLTGDRRLATESAAWDGPLTRARELAPGIDDPHRFAASAYLELWNALTPAKREEAVGLLGRAFTDRRTFGRLLGVWLDLAEEPEDAMAAMPDVPHVWDGFQRELARRGDWAASLKARERWRDALARSFEEQLGEAARRARGGDLENAREIYLSVVATAPLEERFDPVVERALAAAPPGPWQPRMSDRLRPRLERALALELVGRRRLPPELVDRLAGLVGDLPEPLEARAALVAGRLADAERLERGTPLARWHEDWQAYWILKARELLKRGHSNEATVALSRVADDWRDHPAYLLARRDVAAAAGDAATVAVTERRLDALAAEPRPPGAWRRAKGRAETELYVGEPVDSVTLGFAGAPASGTAIEILIDGAVVAAKRVRAGRDLRIPGEIGSGAHLVELRTLAGADPIPGALAAGSRRTGRGRAAADDG